MGAPESLHRSGARQTATGGLLLSIWAVCCTFTPHLFGQADQADEFRRYRDGPLTERDFRQPVPEDHDGLDAFTTTDLRFDFQYRTYRSGRRVRAWSTKIEAFAVVIPKRSWNRQLDDKRLLDHEQGHFDLAQIAAIKAQRHFDESGRLVGVASSEELAVAEVRKQLKQQMEIFIDKLLAENNKYDQITLHGQIRDKQDQQRRRQREQLAELAEEP